MIDPSPNIANIKSSFRNNRNTRIGYFVAESDYSYIPKNIHNTGSDQHSLFLMNGKWV